MKRIFNDKTVKDKRRHFRNNMPEPERRLWYYLRNKQIKGVKFRRQCGVGSDIFDFYSFELRLCIEIDGDSHFGSKEAMDYDLNRTDYLMGQGIEVIGFTNIEIMQNVDSCLLSIEQQIDDIKRKVNPT